MNRSLLTTGIVMLGLAIVVPILFFVTANVQGSSGDGFGAFGSMMMGFFFMGIVSPILGITGLVLLIIGAATGGQQQQQQVVLYQGAPVPGALTTCQRCKADMSPGTRFCASCGAPA